MGRELIDFVLTNNSKMRFYLNFNKESRCSITAKEYINEVEVVIVDLLYLFPQNSPSSVEENLNFAEETIAFVKLYYFI